MTSGVEPEPLCVEAQCLSHHTILFFVCPNECFAEVHYFSLKKWAGICFISISSLFTFLLIIKCWPAINAGKLIHLCVVLPKVLSSKFYGWCYCYLWCCCAQNIHSDCTLLLHCVWSLQFILALWWLLCSFFVLCTYLKLGFFFNTSVYLLWSKRMSLPKCVPYNRLYNYNYNRLMWGLNETCVYIFVLF